MLARSLRRALATQAALLVMAGSVLPASAGQPSRDADPGGSSTVATAQPSARSEPAPRASVDRRVTRAVSRGGVVEALLILDGDRALARARAAVPPGDSRALLRSVVPSYRDLKQGVRSRLPAVTVLRDYATLPILHVLIPTRAALARAASDHAVAGIAANGRLQPALAQSLPLIGQPEAAAAGHTGAGTAVAVIDSGVDYTREAFGSCSAPGAPGCKVAVAQDFAPDDGMLDDGMFHGTNVAGIVVGVAPDTRLLALDVFDEESASTANVLDAIDFTIANQAAFDVRAMNLSLGDVSFHTSRCDAASNPFVPAFENSRAAGILPVVASGNGAAGTEVGVAHPACTPGALTVGAVYDSDVGSVNAGSCRDRATQADLITCFSQVASFLTVLAPGARITAAGVTQLGTSQATPHVSGGVAVLAGSSPQSTPDMIQTAVATSGPIVFDPLIDQGFHRLDLPAAIATLGGTPPPPPPPPPTTCTIEGDERGNLLEGTPGDDVICGNGGNDVLLTNGGNDVVIGGAGFDFVSLENAWAGVEVDIAAGMATTERYTIALDGVEAAIGSRFADSLIGDGGPNEFLGLGGNDLIDGGGGFDYSRYDFATKRIRADLSRAFALGEGTDHLIAIEGLVGSTGDDELVGDRKGNVLDGMKGDDLLEGLGRDDTLLGGPGSDDLFGGRGDDDLLGGPGPDRCDQGTGTGTTSSC